MESQGQESRGVDAQGIPGSGEGWTRAPRAIHGHRHRELRRGRHRFLLNRLGDAVWAQLHGVRVGGCAPLSHSLMKPFALLALALSLSACTSMMNTAGVAPPTAPMTDADILRVFMASNTAEIATSETVDDSGNPAVREFATMMIQMHTQSNERAAALDLEPRENAVSLSMQQMVAGQVRQLSAASGAERDRMYMEKQVVLHGHTLDMLTHVLIPNARDPQLRALLEQARPAVAEHFNRAKMLHHQMMM